MAAVRHRENGFLPLPCPGQAEENYLDAAGADAGRCAGDRWGGGCQWHERWEESSSGPGGAAGAQSAHKGGRGPLGPRPPFGLAGPGAKGPRAAKRRRPPGPLELLPPPKGRKKPGPTLYGAGRTKRCQKGARQRFRPQGKARAHGLRARAVETARRGLLAPGRPQPLLRAYQPARSTAARAGPTCA